MTQGWHIRRTSGAWARSLLLLIAGWSGSAPSEVTLDGSLGGARGPLPGPDFEIGADFGRRGGSNLFHSFGAFNLSASESATFSGPNAIENVLGRVTGGSGSNINGLLRSSIPDANVFLLNPAGIVFGRSARLDVQGSFHASTGDYIRLADGGRFDAVPSAKDALLTTAPPRAFGFLGRQDPAPIEVNGSVLRVPDGKALSLIGGNIQVRGARLVAAAGRVNLASIGATAEVTLGPDDLGVGPPRRGGAVTLSDGSLIDTSGEGGGSVFIRGGEFVMDRSEVRSVTLGNKNGGAVSIEAKQVELQNGARIGTIAMGSGRAGDVLVEADRVSLSGEESPSRTGLPGGIGSAAFGSGDAGAVTVKARDLQVRKGAAISTLTRGSGRAGDVLVEADRVSLADRIPVPEGSLPLSNLPGGIGSVAFDGGGDAGTVTVEARDLQVRKGAAISTLTFGSGRAGDVLVEADRVSLADRIPLPRNGLLSLSSLPGGIGSAAFDGGDAGTVTVKTRDLQVRKGAAISTLTFGSGRAGNVLVDADHVSLADRIPLPGNRSLPGGIGSVAFGSGAAGAVTVKARDLQVRKGAAISTLTFGSGRAGNVLVDADRVSLSGDRSLSKKDLPGGIGSATSGSGSAGAVKVKAGDLDVRNRAVIGTTTRGPGRGGNVRVEANRVSMSGDLVPGDLTFFPTGIFAAAQGPIAVRTGNVTVKTGDLNVRHGARIATDTEANFGLAGNVFVEADHVFLSGDRSRFFPGGIGSVARLSGASGEIMVKAGDLEVRNGAVISTRGSGRGGDLLVEADRVFLSGDGAPLTGIGAPTLDDGVTGTVTVKAEELQVHNGARISSTTDGSAPGGDIFVKADSVLLSGGSISSQSISKSPDAGRSGEIDLDVGFLLHLRDSRITTSVVGGKGRGGNINIDPVFVLLDNSEIIADAFGGPGGNVRIVADHFFASHSVVSASSALSIDGVVEIDSPETDLNAGLVPLPAKFFDAATVLIRPCAERSGADVIRLVVRPYEVLPDSPYALRVQRPNAPPGASHGWRGEHGMATPAALALGCLDGG